MRRQQRVVEENIETLVNMTLSQVNILKQLLRPFCVLLCLPLHMSKAFISPMQLTISNSCSIDIQGINQVQFSLTILLCREMLVRSYSCAKQTM